MKQRILVALLTVVVFAAGYGAATWMERTRSLPPTPTPMAEFNRVGTAAASENKKPVVDRAHIVREIDKYRAEIEAYRARLKAIDSEFDDELAKILTPAQLEKHEAQRKREAESIARKQSAAASPEPLTDEEILRLENPVYTVIWMSTVSHKLDRLKRDFKLDPEQEKKARDLICVRKEKFLELLESSPPPSISFSRLAPMVQRVAVAEGAKE